MQALLVDSVRKQKGSRVAVSVGVGVGVLGVRSDVRVVLGALLHLQVSLCHHFQQPVQGEDVVEDLHAQLHALALRVVRQVVRHRGVGVQDELQPGRTGLWDS